MKYVFIGGDKTLSYRACGVKFEDGKVYDDSDFRRYIENHSIYFEEESLHLAKFGVKKVKDEVVIEDVEKFDTNIVNIDISDEEILVDEDAKIFDVEDEKLDQDIIDFLESDNKEEFLKNGLHWKKISQIAEHYGLEWTKKDSTIKNIMDAYNEDNK